jgi:hypothetical protein
MKVRFTSTYGGCHGHDCTWHLSEVEVTLTIIQSWSWQP